MTDRDINIYSKKFQIYQLKQITLFHKVENYN